MRCRVPQKRYQSLNDFCGALKDGMAYPAAFGVRGHCCLKAQIAKISDNEFSEVSHTCRACTADPVRSCL